MIGIGIIGLGFVGLAHAVVYSSKGYRVVGIDIDEEKISLLRKGLSYIEEPQLKDLLRRGLDSKKLIFDTDYKRLVEEDVNTIFIAVDTPTRGHKQDLGNLLSALKSLGELYRNEYREPALAVKSTILPGSSRNYIIPYLEKILGRRVKIYVFNPEFLRESSAIEDILYPSRVVIGEYNSESGEYFNKFFREFYRSSHPPIIRTTLEASELAKYASNLFLSCKLSFINAISYVCESIKNCDILDIRRIMGLDERIGSRYLHPGIGFGGSCLPKDLKAFIGFMREYKPYDKFFEEIDKINSYQVKLPVQKALKLYGSLKGRVITILGLSYKGGVNDIRGSKSIELIKEFLRLGAIVKAYDPVSNDDFNKFIKRFKWYKENSDRLIVCESINMAIEDSDMIIIATDWEEFKELDPKIVKTLSRNHVIYDGRRILDARRFIASGIRYYGIGFGRDEE